MAWAARPPTVAARWGLIGALVAAGPGMAEPIPAPSATPSTIVARMGVVMPESRARHSIAFSPFRPPRHIVAVALLPPFHGNDDRHGRGIGFEYADVAGRRYALAEWPANGGSIGRFPPLAQADQRCPTARTFLRGTGPNGIVWSTARGQVRSLAAEGANDARTLISEWSKLIRRGACD